MIQITLMTGIKILASIVALIMAFGSGLYWVLKHKIRDDLNMEYIRKEECESNQKIMNIMTKAIKDKVDSMDDKLDMAINFILNGRKKI